MYFVVSFIVDKGKMIYPDEIVKGDSKEKVEQRYRSKYPDASLIVSEAFSWEVEAAEAKGKPIAEVK